MSKWYRPSISLAAKCRMGFALAVLLLIGGGLSLPYIWMDKLVEQGKRELAQAEVQQVLMRHFKPSKGPDSTGQAPPLALEAGGLEPVKPARWAILGDGPTANGQTRPTYLIAPAETDDTAEHSGLGGKLQAKPFTQWIPLDAPTARQQDSPEQLSRDKFLLTGIEEFSDNPVEYEIFSLRAQPRKISSVTPHSGVLSDDLDSGYTGRFGGLLKGLSWAQPSRYLRAVRADRSCLGGGCHGKPSVESDENNPSVELLPQFSEGDLVGVISVVLPAGQTVATLVFNRILIIVAGLLSAIIAVIAFYLITQRFILRPVRLLRRATDQLSVALEDGSESGNEESASWQDVLDTTANIRTGDEFERLAKAFNEMLTRLKLAHDRLRESNRALDMRLGELEARNVALFEANKLKNEFLANVSHELRTPLNAILGFADILKDQAQHRDDPKGMRYISNVLESGRVLLGIINDLLDLAKIEAGKMEVHLEKCSVREIAEALLSFTRPMAEKKSLTVTLSVDKSLGLVETDGGKLQQVLFNLLSNAIKFTPPHGKIAISARPLEGGFFELQVSDTGPGIPEKDREKIFEKFRQLDASITREHPGTGLGLAIVKELVTVLSGRISVWGEADRGAVFTVTLPISLAASN